MKMPHVWDCAIILMNLFKHFVFYSSTGAALVRAIGINFRGQEGAPGEKDKFTLDVLASFSQASDNIHGTGLWKVSIYGSNTENGYGEQFQRVDQLLSDAQQAQPLVNGQNITFQDIQGKFDHSAVGCDMAFRYICFDFMKGDNPSTVFTFTTGKIPNKMTYCSDQCPPLEGNV